ncbi:MAG: class I SAM-dependent methyltransferase [Deltaproteobacteria bacterium]|nr:class I SAM-dependent methyltransferase [Deltaproteobacteria bacterium]
MRKRSLPWWATAVLAIDRAFERARDLEKQVRDELFLSFGRERAEDITIAIYDRNEEYRPGGKRDPFVGLHDWEAKLVHDRRFPTTGRLLVGAAGGGREIAVLTRLGYHVDAFEPSPSLFASAEEVARRSGRARVARGTYAELCDAVDGRGPLADLVAAGRYDAVMLGWGSYSHVLDRAQRVALLRAVARLTRGPLVVSFEVRRPPMRRTDRMPRLVQNAARAFGRGAPPPELVFYGNVGFLASFDRQMLEGEAADAGWTVSTFAETPYGYALLTRSA